MRTVRTIRELRSALAPARVESQRIGFVPTMGALHEGHLSLIRAAAEDCEVVVLSIFVNPTQFRADEDLGAYPRDEAQDATRADEAGATLLYAPEVEDVYPDGFATTVAVRGLTEVLCGTEAARGVGHFDGVTTVVTKLLNQVGPDVLYLGQKDAQQALVISRMVRDLDMPIRVQTMPTIRENDGLAMSSRNAYLDQRDRDRAPALYRALESARQAAAAGVTSRQGLLDRARSVLDDAGVEPEYLEALDAEDLRPVAELNGRPILVAVAARLGAARLIDNVTITPNSTGEGDQCNDTC